jgi:hypothetical protein
MGKKRQIGCCGVGLTNYIKMTKTLPRHNNYCMVLDVHGSIRNRTPFWTLVCNDTKQIMGEIGFDGQWKTRPRVADDIKKEAESLTLEYSEVIVDVFHNGMPDVEQEY